MPDIRELGRLTKQKFPGSYDKIDDAEFGRLIKAKYPGSYNQFVDAPSQGAALTGVQGMLRSVGDAAQAAGELVTSALHGDFRPLKETAELAVRGAAPIAAAFNAPYTPLPAYLNRA